MSQQIEMAAHYTSIGMLTRTCKRGQPYVWYVVGFDGQQFYTGRFEELRKNVREEHGESVEAEIVAAAHEIVQVNDD
jgi:hypothetical protein